MQLRLFPMLVLTLTLPPRLCTSERCHSLWWHCSEKLTDQHLCNLVKGTYNGFCPHLFTDESYNMKMKNGEKIYCNRLVYVIMSCSAFALWKEKQNSLLVGVDIVCCTIFTATFFLNTRELILQILQTLHELDERLKKGATIDSAYQDLSVPDVQDWRAMLTKIIAIVCHWAERNQAQRGQLFKAHNGNSLGRIELMAQFDPVMSEPLRRINKKSNQRSLSEQYQN